MIYNMLIFLDNYLEMGHPDEIRRTKISSRLNKGNKDLTGQVGQADEHRFHPRLIWKNWLLESEKRNSE